MLTVNMHEAKTQFSKLIARVEKGEEIVIARDGTPVARLVAFRQPVTKRIPAVTATSSPCLKISTRRCRKTLSPNSSRETAARHAFLALVEHRARTTRGSNTPADRRFAE